ncbi:hypothetical protein D3C72_2208880 [compost metagenome]
MMISSAITIILKTVVGTITTTIMTTIVMTITVSTQVVTGVWVKLYRVNTAVHVFKSVTVKHAA